MVNPDKRQPILVATSAGGIRELAWHQSPWEMPKACVLWWQHQTGWQFGPAHVFHSDLAIAGDVPAVNEQAKRYRRRSG